MAIKTRNVDFGFYGTISLYAGKRYADVLWPVALSAIAEVFEASEEWARDYLDEPHGRQIADRVICNYSKSKDGGETRYFPKNIKMLVSKHLTGKST